LGLLVDAYMDKDELEKALKLARDGLAQFQRMSDGQQEAVAQDLLFRVHLARDEYELALNAAQQGYEICNRMQMADWEADMLLNLCRVYVKVDQFKEALEAAQEAKRVFKFENDDHQAFALHVISVVKVLMGNVDEGINGFTKARQLFTRAGNRNGEAMTYLLHAATLALKKDFPQAFNLAGKAQEIWQDREDKRGEAIALYSMISLRMEKKDYAQAFKFATQRRSILQDAGFKRAEGRSLHTVANVQTWQDSYKEAAKTAKDGLKLAKATVDRATEVHLMLQVVQADIMILQEEADASKVGKAQATLEEATKVMKQASALAKKVGDVQLNADTMYWNAQLLISAGDEVEQALNAAAQALEQHRQCRDSIGEGNDLVLLAQIHSLTGNKQRAEEYASSSLSHFQWIQMEEGVALAEQVLEKIQGPKMAAPMPVIAHSGAVVSVAGAVSSQAAIVSRGGLDSSAVKAKLMEMVKNTLGSGDEVYSDEPLMDKGLDSLSSVQFRNDVSSEFNARFPASLLFDFPTVSALTRHIMETVE